MFSQVSLELKPSIRVAILLSIPCIASLILIILAQIPFIILIPLVCIHLILSYRFISNMAFLSFPSSIKCLEINEQAIFLEDKRGQRYIATPSGKNILYQAFSLLSFVCEKSNSLPAQTDVTQAKSKQYQESDTEIISTNFDRPRSGFITNKLYINSQSLIRKNFLFKNRRHLFICRYNAVNSSDFRRVRVWFRFKV